MHLEVAEFVAVSEDYSQLQELGLYEDQETRVFRIIDSCPVGLDPKDTKDDDIELLCKATAQQMSLLPRPEIEAKRGDISPIVRDVYNIILRFTTSVTVIHPSRCWMLSR